MSFKLLWGLYSSFNLEKKCLMRAVILTVVLVDEGEYRMPDIFMVFWTATIYDGGLLIIFVTVLGSAICIYKYYIC